MPCPPPRRETRERSAFSPGLFPPGHAHFSGGVSPISPVRLPRCVPPGLAATMSQAGNDLGPDRDHSEKQRKRGQCRGLFGKNSEHQTLPLIRTKEEHSSYYVLVKGAVGAVFTIHSRPGAHSRPWCAGPRKSRPARRWRRCRVASNTLRPWRSRNAHPLRRRSLPRSANADVEQGAKADCAKSGPPREFVREEARSGGLVWRPASRATHRMESCCFGAAFHQTRRTR
jgi:hypothetical protein